MSGFDTTGSSLQLDSNTTPCPLVLAFGGMSSELSMPVFEFRRFLTTHAQCNFIFFRDIDQIWYHEGVRGLSNSIDDTVTKLKAKIAEVPHSKLITIGTSAGGYAALLFGILLSADTVLSFSPQTFLDDPNRISLGDSQWDNYISKLYQRTGTKTGKYFDLLLLEEPAKQVKDICLILGTLDAVDCKHVRRLLPWNNVTLIEVPTGHSCVKKMKETGDLLKLIKKYII